MTLESTDTPVSSVSEAASDTEQAQEILARAQALMDKLPETSDPIASQDIRNALVGVRAELLALVVNRYGGSTHDAIASDDFDDEFKIITQAIQPPQKHNSRPFPGSRRLNTGDNGRTFVGDK